MLIVKNLRKQYGALHAVQDVSLVVSSGDRHALIGPNGAGKTTLFNLLSGEIRPDSGSIEFDGVDCTRSSADAHARAGIGRSFQQNNLFEGLSVSENLVTALVVSMGYGQRWWRALSKVSELEVRAKELAETIGLTELLDTPVRKLSYGLQRQLEVGLALATEPKLLLLDEPTAGMGPSETDLMVSLIGKLPSSLTVLIVEHDMEVVFKVANQITVLDEGAILYEGSSDEVRRSHVVQSRYLGPFLDKGAISNDGSSHEERDSPRVRATYLDPPG